MSDEPRETTTEVEWLVDGKRYVVRSVPVTMTHLGEEVWDLEVMDILEGLHGLMVRGEIAPTMDFRDYAHRNFDVPPPFPPRY